MNVQPIRLVGGRAMLVPMETAHIAELFAAGDHPEIWPYMSLRVERYEDMERLVRDALAARDEGKELPFTIIDRDEDRIVGSTRFLDIDRVHRNLEIGWTWLSPSVWRTRINTECKYLLLRHSFETLDALRVQLKTDARNLRSRQAIDRLGAAKEGVLRRHRILPDGYVRDSVYYSIVAEEWPAVRERLEERLFVRS